MPYFKFYVVNQSSVSRRDLVKTATGASVISMSGCLRLTGSESSEATEPDPDIRGFLQAVHHRGSDVFLGTNTAWYRVPTNGSSEPSLVLNRPILSFVETTDGLYVADFSKIFRWEDGESVWQQQFAPIKTGIQHYGGLVFGTARNLIRLTDRPQPNVSWQTSVSEIREIVGVANGVVVVRTRSDIRGFDVQSGSDGFDPISNDVFTAALSQDLLVTDEQIYRIGSDSSSSVTQLETDLIPTLVTSAVGGSDAIYAAWNNKVGRIVSSGPALEWDTSLPRDVDLLSFGDTKVYAGVTEDGQTTRILALDSQTGDQLWNTELVGEEVRSIFSVADILLVETVLSESESVNKYGLDALDTTSGDIAWSLQARYELS